MWRTWTYHNLRSIEILGRPVDSELVERIKYLWKVFFRVNPLTAPQVTLREGAELEVGDNAKVVASASQGPVQV
jgi:hypothetical protein